MKYLFLFLPLFCFGQTTKTVDVVKDTTVMIEFGTGTESPIYSKQHSLAYLYTTKLIVVEKPVTTKLYNNGKEVDSTSLDRINVFVTAAEFAKEGNKQCLELMGLLINCATHCEDAAFEHFYQKTYPQYLKDLFSNPETAYCAFQIYSKL